MLDPNLGVVLQSFTAIEPVTYKVLFFDGEDGRRDIYWEEDLIRLNERERDLFLKTYPDEMREKMLRLSRRNRERSRQ